MSSSSLQRAPESRRYAFVGTGHRAEMYITALIDSHSDVGHPVALCDVNRTRMAHYNDLWCAADPTHQPLPTYDAADFAAMLDKERPDAVVVTSVDSTHHLFVTEALARDCDVVVEKPLTTTFEGCTAIVDAAERSDAGVVVTFNYRYAPRNSMVKQLLDEGAIGQVTSVHFEWLLDTVHGADYFRRWHRVKDNSGGLLVHKSTHHFDLVNWWLGATPRTVFAFGGLRFYGSENARARGMADRPIRSHDATAGGSDPFALSLADDERLRRLYLDAEHEDGYLRDLDVFGEGITIEDNMAVLVRYAQGATLTYSLNAHAPWEGYRVGINGTEGRLELSVCERAEVVRSGGEVADSPAADPSTTSHPDGAAADTDHGHTGRPADPVRSEGSQLVLQRHWEPARRVEIPEGDGAHGGGDARLLDDILRGSSPDPLGRQASYADGVRSVLVGAAANRSLITGQPVQLTDAEFPLGVR